MKLSKIIKSENKNLTKSVELEEYYSILNTKTLRHIKANYEAVEEDNKQIAIISLLVGGSLTLFTTTLTSLTKEPSIEKLIIGVIYVMILVIGAAAVGAVISARNIRTTRNRKIIDIVLADREAANKSITNPKS